MGAGRVPSSESTAHSAESPLLSALGRPRCWASSFSSSPPPASGFDIVMYCRWSGVPLTRGRKEPTDLLFWAVATSSLECHGWRGFLINSQLSAKVKKVSSGFPVALQRYYCCASAPQVRPNALSGILFPSGLN